MGAAEATLFAEEGAQVVIGDVRADEAEGLAAEINRTVKRDAAISVHLDVALESSWSDAIRTVERYWGPVSVLVNNAGVISSSGLMEGTEEEWNRIVSINQKGVWLGMRAVVPGMRRVGGGSIVNISSVGGLVGTAIQTIYHGTKGAVRLLTKAAAANLAPDNIRVNSVHPGAIQTDMLGSISEQELELYSGAAPLCRIGTPREVAWAAVFLASDESSFVTGAELAVDGGYSAI